MLARSLKKLNERVLGLGVYQATQQRSKTLILGYLAVSLTESRLATTTVRKTLKAILNKPDSFFRWTEVIRRKEGAHWEARCNGIEIRLVPFFEERIMHHLSMYRVMEIHRFGAWTSMPVAQYDAMRQEVRAMPFRERLELARSLEIGHQLFPWECGAEFRQVAGTEILCLTGSQLQVLLHNRPYLQEQYAGIQSIESDPIPCLF